jgi:hypothetical protein
MRHRTVKTVYREAKSGTTRAYKYPLEVNMRTLFSGLLPQLYHAPINNTLSSLDEGENNVGLVWEIIQMLPVQNRNYSLDLI